MMACLKLNSSLGASKPTGLKKIYLKSTELTMMACLKLNSSLGASKPTGLKKIYPKSTEVII
jgi:hypothetical protein